MISPTEPLPPEEPTPSPDANGALTAIVEAFIARRRAGEDVDAAELILAHPAIAAELEQRLAAAEVLLSLAQSKDTAGRAMPLPSAVGRYQIRSQLGRGSSSAVYRAYDPKFDRDVALKVFQADLSDAQSAERFDRDARHLARLRHSHIVPLHEAGTHDGYSYIDMELIPGESLEDRLGRDGWPDFRTAAEMVRKVAAALHHAHQAGVVHRDVKPSNILIDADGEPQLTDFGLARRVDAGHTLTAAGQILGTPAYMSPEQARGESHRADARSDVFSLGVVLYRLLTGRLPFVADDSVALLRQIADAPPPRPRAVRPDVPRDLETICLKALEKDPADRLATAAAFADELRRWLADESLTIRPPTRWDRCRRWLRAQKPMVRWLLTATGALMVVTTMLGWTAWLLHEKVAVVAEANARVQTWSVLEQAWHRVRSPIEGHQFETQKLLRKLAVQRKFITDPEELERIDLEARSIFAESLGLPELRVGDWGHAQLTDSADAQFLTWPTAIHPSGEWVVISTQAGPVRWDRGHPPPPITEVGKPQARPRVGFSPDGKYLTVAPTTGGLTVWDGATIRHLKKLEEPDGSPVLAVGYSASGDVLWAGSADGRIRSWTLTNFQAASDKPTGAGTHWTAARFSTDAQWLAAGDATGSVRIFDQGGKQVHALENPHDRMAIESLAWSPTDSRLLAVGAKDGSVELWDQGKNPLHRFTPFTHGVSGIEFTPDGRWLLAGASKVGMQLWDVATGELLLTARETCTSVPFGFSRDGRWLAAGDWARASFAKLEIPDVVQHLRGHAAQVDRLAWSRDGRTLASLDTRFQVRVWDVKREKRDVAFFVPRPNGDFFAQNAAIALSDDGRLLAYASGGERPAKAVIYDIATSKPLQKWETLPGGYEQLIAVGPGRFLLVREQIDDDGENVQTVVWQLEAGTKELPPSRLLRPSAPGDQWRYFESGLTPDGRLHWWTGPRRPSANYRVEVRRVDTGELVKTVPLPSANELAVIGALIDPTGQLMWTGLSGDERLYHLDGSHPPTTVARCPGAVTAGGDWMTISEEDTRRGPVGQLVMGGASRPWLVIADDRNMRTIPTFSPDGRYLACGSQSGTVTVIDLFALQREVAACEAGQ